MTRWILFMAITTLVGSGCATTIPKTVMDQVNRNIAFEALRENPAAFKGQTVLLAGVIVKTTNTPTGTILEIYQTEMDWEDRPIHTDVSKGRFLAQDGRFLDPEIYSKQRLVTVAGKVMGEKRLKLGEMAYPYPVIGVAAIHLWKKTKQLPYDPYPWYPMGAVWGPWAGPWGFWNPWYGPYWY